MYKLTVVSGPNRGTSYAVQDGENSIGRQAGNTVVLQSAKVSKRHCVLVVNNGEILMQDQGSSNGTFVNGVLTKTKTVKAGDRISVGEYVFELSEPSTRAPRAAPAVAGLGNILQFPSTQRPGQLPVLELGSASAPAAGLPNAMPKDLKGKLFHILDNNIMPFFYTLNLKHEWRALVIVAFALFAVGNLVISVYPLMEQNRASLVKEAGKRAQFMAQQIAERNSSFLAARAETKTEVGSIENAEGVRVALLTDLDNRILAPGTKFNQYFTSGAEAAFAVKAKDAFRNGRETGIVRELDDTTICAIEPVKVMSQTAGRNIPVGMAIVSIDTSLSTPDFGEMGVTYSETLVLTGILGSIILLILYKLTLKPLLVLNEDMDKVLKGVLPQVTREFKFGELDSLWDIINSALQRVPKGGVPGGMGTGGAGIEEFEGPLKMLGNIAKFGMAILDAEKKIIFVNPMFEEISGIRSDQSIGQEFSSVARDQSLGAFVTDLIDRVSTGSEGTAEDYEFSGITYRCHLASFGSPGASARCYLLAAVRGE